MSADDEIITLTRLDIAPNRCKLTSMHYTITLTTEDCNVQHDHIRIINHYKDARDAFKHRFQSIK